MLQSKYKVDRKKLHTNDIQKLTVTNMFIYNNP